MKESPTNSSSSFASNTTATLQFRLLGFLPLAFFIAQAVHYWRINELGHMLWMCNIGNLLLAIGFFLNQTRLIRVAVIWMIPGLGVWIFYVALAWGMFLSSTLAHVGGIIVGMVALRKVRMDRTAWVYALGWYLVIQLVSYLITPAELNVNVSHKVASGWEQTFDSYWKFWLVLTAGTAAILWILGTVLEKLWPARPELESTFKFRRKPKVG
ncbi:MAG: hypothetical protein ACREBG_12840 [Pyrinomonadaceae bacterium]